MKLRQTLLSFSIALSIVACGSDDSGGSGSVGIDTSAVSNDPVTITSKNGKEVAAASVSTTNAMNSGNGSDDTTITKSRRKTVNKFIARTIIKTKNISSRDSETTELECDSGSISVTSHDNNNNLVFDGGDSLFLDFDQCSSDDAGVNSVIDGGLTLQINFLSDDSTSLNASVIFHNLKVIENGETGGIDGQFALDLQSIYSNTLFRVSGPRIAFVDEDNSGVLNDFDMSTNYNVTTDTWRQSQSATFSSTQIGGQIVITTITELQGTGDNHPTTGELKISGADGTYILINADTGNADTVVVTTFDGSSTTSEELNWQELE